jgi:hypothetical protein
VGPPPRLASSVKSDQTSSSSSSGAGRRRQDRRRRPDRRRCRANRRPRRSMSSRSSSARSASASTSTFFFWLPRTGIGCLDLSTGSGVHCFAAFDAGHRVILAQIVEALPHFGQVRLAPHSGLTIVNSSNLAPAGHGKRKKLQNRVSRWVIDQQSSQGNSRQAPCHRACALSKAARLARSRKLPLVRSPRPLCRPRRSCPPARCAARSACRATSRSATARSCSARWPWAKPDDRPAGRRGRAGHRRRHARDGAQIERRMKASGRSTASASAPAAARSPLDMGNSGTSTRLLMGLVASHAITATFVGDASLSKRPMGRVIDPLPDGRRHRGQSRRHPAPDRARRFPPCRSPTACRSPARR